MRPTKKIPLARIALSSASLTALFALAHCSLTSDLDALSRGGLDAGPGAASDGSAAQPGSDASPSAPPADAASLPEADAAAPLEDASGGAPEDAGTPNEPAIFPDGGKQGPTWCDGHGASTFCADFDDAPLPSGFTSTEGTFLGLTSTKASSGPNTLLLLIPPTQAGGVLASKLARTFPAASTSAALAFDFYPEKLNTGTSGLLFAALDYVGNPAAKYSVRLAYNQGLARLEESYLGFPTDVFHSSFALPEKTWSRVRVELAFGGDAGPSTVSVYVNDKAVASSEALAPPANVDYRPTLLVGAVYGTSPQNGWILRYDNVTLDTH